MTELHFEWDARKAAANRRKHGVTFEEDRFILMGLSSRLRTLVVCHCYRQTDEAIRIISARKADRAERVQYEQRRAR